MSDNGISDCYTINQMDLILHLMLNKIFYKCYRRPLPIIHCNTLDDICVVPDAPPPHNYLLTPTTGA